MGLEDYPFLLGFDLFSGVFALGFQGGGKSDFEGTKVDLLHF